MSGLNINETDGPEIPNHNQLPRRVETNEQGQVEVDVGVAREHGEDRNQNTNNEPRAEGGEVVQLQPPQENHQLQPQNEGQGAQQANNHPFLDPDDIFILLMNYLCLPVAKCCVPLVAAWWLLMLTSGNPQGELFYGSVAFSVLTFLASVRHLLKRPDFSAHDFRALDIRSLQLTFMALICNGLDFIFNFFAPQFRLFFFNVRDSAIFFNQLEWVRQVPFQDYFTNWQSVWLQINHQFILVSFAMLFLIDILATMHRMTKRNNIIKQILRFEIVAFTQPLFSLVLPMALMDIIAVTVPPDKQTPMLWLCLHILALGWTFLVLHAVVYYREIPLRRPMGIRGYLLMYSVAMLQVAIGITMLMSIGLVRNLYFELIPGAYTAYLNSPGFILGISRFFDQVSARAVGSSQEWSQTLPYNFTYDSLHGLSLFIFLIRYIKLNQFIEEVQDRLDRDDAVGVVI